MDNNEYLRIVKEVTYYLDYHNNKHTYSYDFKIISNNMDKICLRYKNVFIKTVYKRFSYYNSLIQNEVGYAIILNNYTSYVPSLFWGGEYDGRWFAVYEFLEGKKLNDVMNDWPLSKRIIKQICEQVWEFIQIIQLSNFVHNDLTPNNIIVSKNIKVKIIDYEFFGIAVNKNTNRDWLPFKTNIKGEEDLLIKLIRILGGKYRSPAGPGCFENDIYAFKMIVSELESKYKLKQNIRKIIKYVKHVLRSIAILIYSMPYNNITDWRNN